MKKVLLSFLICLTFALPANAEEIKCDVAVVGGGCGGCAAALQAARLGASVTVLEETEMLVKGLQVMLKLFPRAKDGIFTFEPKDIWKIQ